MLLLNTINQIVGKEGKEGQFLVDIELTTDKDSVKRGSSQIDLSMDRSREGGENFDKI